MNPRIALAVRIASIAIVAVLLWLFLRSIEWHALGVALRHAHVLPLILSSVLFFVCLFGKALSWRIMLAPQHVVPIGHLYRYTIAAFAASTFTPVRAGEVLRVWALKRRDGVPVVESTAVAINEKLIDAITLLLFCAPIPWLLTTLPTWVADTILLTAGAALGVFLVLYIAVGRMKARETRSWFGRFIAGMHVVRSPHRMLLLVIVKLLGWAADLMAVMFVLYAVGIDVPIAAGMFILFTFNLAIVIPSTPAQIGTLQVGVLIATDLLGVPREPALAFALLYQAMQVVPVLVVGLILELNLVLGRGPTTAREHPVPVR